MIRPFLQAGGHGRRMQQPDIQKTMLSVDGIYPLIGNAVMRFMGLGFAPHDMTIMVGHKGHQVIDYLGEDSGFNFYHQDKVGDPTDGMMDWITNECSDEWGENTMVSVANVDDAGWFTSDNVQKLLTMCDHSSREGLLLTTRYQVGQHKYGFIVGQHEVLDCVEGFDQDAAYIGGLFVIKPQQFADAYHEAGGALNVVTYFAQKDPTVSPVVHVTDEQPRVCVNTPEALAEARHIYSKFRVGYV